MSKDEINRKISKFKGNVVIDLPFVPRSVVITENTYFTDAAADQWRKQYPTGMNVQRITDWHSDSNWPTLLRELISSGDIGEKVCLAWLKWKEQ